MPAPILSLYPGKSGNQEGRGYRKPGTGRGGVPPVTLPSVTTILKHADKSGLTQWAIGLTLDAVNKNPDMVYQRSDQDMKRHFQYQWHKVRDERAEVGTGIHETIEAIHTGSDRYPFLDDEQMRIMQRWEDFNFHHRVEPVHTEFTVWNEEVRYAGTADGLWYIDGKLTTVDLKTSKNTWPEHFAQLAALRYAPYAWIQCKKDDDGALLHVDPKKRETYWKQIPNPALESESVCIVHLREDLWELIEVENVDVHWEVFKGYSLVHHSKAKLKELEKGVTLAVAELEELED